MTTAMGLDRVVYVGTGRRRGRWVFNEPERAWRQRLAQEMEEVCQEMARRGLHLTRVVPILSSTGLQGAWTEGAWLFFTAESSPPPR